MMIVRSAVAAMIGTTIAAIGPSPASAEDGPKRGGVLTYAVVADAPTYDCHAADSFATLHFVAPHYSTLLRIDAAHYPQITGDLAKSWSVEGDGRKYVFHLNPEARFHDGSRLTAADVKASFDRIRNPPDGVVSVRKALYDDIAAIYAPDPQTVMFRLEEPNAAMVTLLASPWNCIYSAALLQSNPDYPARVVMGSGPFRFVEHVAGAKWVGRRFDGYFRPGLPYLDGFEAYVLSSTGLVNALRGGQVMAEFRGISPAERDLLRQAMGEGITVQESARIADFQLSFNTARKPFDDVRVRRALTLAIDRWSAAPQFRRTTIAGVVGGLLRPGYALARKDEELETLPGFARDGATAKAEARRLLKEAGQDQLTFTLTNRSVTDPYSAIGIYAIDQWRQIGVTVTQEALPSARWSAVRAAGNFDAIVDFTADFADEPVLQLAHYLSHDRAPDNASQVIDRTLDGLYKRQQRTSDAAERMKLVRDFEERVLEQAYVAPVSWGYRIVPLAASVKGYITTPNHFVNQDLAQVWLDGQRTEDRGRMTDKRE